MCGENQTCECKMNLSNTSAIIKFRRANLIPEIPKQLSNCCVQRHALIRMDGETKSCFTSINSLTSNKLRVPICLFAGKQQRASKMRACLNANANTKMKKCGISNRDRSTKWAMCVSGSLRQCRCGTELGLTRLWLTR